MNKYFLLGVSGLISICATPSIAANPTGPLSNLPGTQALKPPETPSFTFFACGDNRPASADLPATDTVKTILAAAARSKPTFIIWLGDTIYGKNPDSEKTISAEYTEFLNLAAQTHVPIFNAPGNHEMDNKDDVPNPIMQSWYEKYMAQKYGSFAYGNSAFIALDTEEIAPPGVPRSPGKPIGGDKNLDPGYVSQTQLNWLQAQLEQFHNKTHVFIFMHHSVYASDPTAALDRASGNAIKQIISQFRNVSFLLAAHEHLYYNPQSPNDVTHAPSHNAGEPPTYLVSGGAGAPLNSGPGGYYHYLVFNVHGKKVVPQIVPIK